MIKRTTALFFILLANIALLVHAVVPHHHHKSLVCIESSHCQSDSYAHNHSTTAHDHEHDGNAGTECCVLKQAVVIPANFLRQEFKCLGCDDNNSPFVHFQAILFSNEFKSFVPKIISIAQIPLKTSSHSCFVSTSSGLRAPPIV
ncbi:MAG: hypothetical protein Q8M67_02145 [Bacteroidota bacterium]|nr:hypothetical protein [Bacteroidota bacterium]